MSFLSEDSLTETKFTGENIHILIKGTSTLHHWEMKSDKGICEAIMVLGENDKLTDLSDLKFSMASENLKSEHTSMNNKTYEALRSDNFRTINFVLSSAKVTQTDAINYQLSCKGKLTIAGTMQETDLVVECKYNQADRSFTCTGTKKLKMTDYKIKPPAVMLGTIKTGDEISVSFTTIMIRK